MSFVQSLVPFVVEDFLGLLWNDEDCVSRPRTEMIPSGESESKSSKEGFRRDLAFGRIRFKPNNPLRRNSIQVLSLKQEIKQSH